MGTLGSTSSCCASSSSADGMLPAAPDLPREARNRPRPQNHRPFGVIKKILSRTDSGFAPCGLPVAPRGGAPSSSGGRGHQHGVDDVDGGVGGLHVAADHVRTGLAVALTGATQFAGGADGSFAATDSLINVISPPKSDHAER